MRGVTCATCYTTMLVWRAARMHVVAAPHIRAVVTLPAMRRVRCDKSLFANVCYLHQSRHARRPLASWLESFIPPLAFYPTPAATVSVQGANKPGLTEHRARSTWTQLGQNQTIQATSSTLCKTAARHGPSAEDKSRNAPIRHRRPGIGIMTTSRTFWMLKAANINT